MTIWVKCISRSTILIALMKTIYHKTVTLFLYFLNICNVLRSKGLIMLLLETEIGFGEL